jgi:hypothetical protein
MTKSEAASIGKLVFLVAAFAMALSLMGCATGPLGSHGVDYVPAFVNQNEGVGR